jgi:hypothetical protein
MALNEDTASDIEAETASIGSTGKRSRGSADSSSTRAVKKTKAVPIGKQSTSSTTSHKSASPLDAMTQLGSYALEMLGSTGGTRLHTLGVLLRDDLVSLWYFDASGVVRTSKDKGKETERLSLIDHFERVAAIFIALAYCNEEQFGAIPETILTRPPNYMFPASNLTGHTVRFPSLEENSDNHPYVVTLGDHIYTQYALVGRRTTVYHGTANQGTHKKVVVKMSQQYSTRASEAELIKIAQEKGADHIPDVLQCGDLWRMSNSDSIRQAFGTSYDDRIYRCIVMPYYTPLAQKLAQDPDSLKTMARQLIFCV